MRSMWAPVSSSRNSTAIERRRTVSAWAISSSERARRRSSLRSSTSSWSICATVIAQLPSGEDRDGDEHGRAKYGQNGSAEQHCSYSAERGQNQSGRLAPRRPPTLGSGIVGDGPWRDAPSRLRTLAAGAAQQGSQLAGRRVSLGCARARVGAPARERRPAWGGPFQANLCCATHEKHSVLTLLVYSAELDVRLSYPETSYANQVEPLVVISIVRRTSSPDTRRCPRNLPRARIRTALRPRRERRGLRRCLG